MSSQGMPQGSRLRKFDVASMLATDPPPVPWLVEGLAARGCLTMLAGREGVGKSMLAVALGVCMASGGGRVGPLTCHGGPVLIVDAENGEHEAHRRVRGLGLPEGMVGVFSWFECVAGDLLNPQGITDLDDVLAEMRPSLVVLDSFASLWRGRENEAENVQPDLDVLRNLLRRHDAGGLLLHHQGKGGAEYRGSTAIGAACEITAGLGREKDDPDPSRMFLQPGKVRPAARGPRLWLRMTAERGAVFVEEAEPYENDTGAPVGRPPSVRDSICGGVLDVLGSADAPMSQGAICAALDRPRNDQTTRRALRVLLDAGEVQHGADGYTAGVSIPAEPLGMPEVLTPLDVPLPLAIEGVPPAESVAPSVKTCNRCHEPWHGIGSICDPCCERLDAP
jgi:hypothetical protein